MPQNIFEIVVPSLIGFVAIILYSFIAAQKQMRGRKNGYVATSYQDKMPHEYSPAQKKYTLIIAVFILGTTFLAGYFLFNRQQMLAQLSLLTGTIVWGAMIKFGNNIK
ncbi:hypothetical protein HGA91_05870 [candidate division WWE3 bacterium]|nr:hypothetical protein [candidate division WWE3 bacterium]